MILRTFITLILAAGFLIDSNIFAQDLPDSLPKIADGVLLIDNFEDDEVSTLPGKWFDQKVNRRVPEFPEEEKKKFKYKILEENGNKFLRYEGNVPQHLNFPLGEVEGLNTYEYPILSWKWRPHVLPEGAREDKDSKNDSVASIYVVWEWKKILFKKVPRSVRYTWSSTLEVGANPSNLFGHQQIVVIRSGEEGLGEWHTFERNIVEDYRKYYGEEPPEKPLAILLFSDASSTQTWAKNDFDDIMILKKDAQANLSAN